ncbi:uncharacterized protein [Miscanthus floridulus]|uniref:uncharacterized protein n=1 Tax=Miscanthus floridulus TaxID=154761 RepID=UPI0034579800
MECWRRAVVDNGLDRGTGAPGRAQRRQGYSSEVWVGVGMPSGEEEGAASGRGGPGKRNGGGVARMASGAARGSSLRGAASGLLRRGGRASGCPPVRKAASGVAEKAKSTAAWRAGGVEGDRGLLGEGRGVEATPARWVSLGVPFGEEGGVGGGQGGESAATKLWGRAEDEDDR